MEAIYQGVDIIFHNSLYSILGIIGLLVIIAFATIFFKSYKEYKTTMSSSYYYEKKVSNLNIPNIQKPQENKTKTENISTEVNLKEEAILQKNVEERKKEVEQEVLKQKEQIAEKTQKQVLVKKPEDILIARRPSNGQNSSQNVVSISKFGASNSEIKGRNTYIQKMIKEIEKDSKKSA